MGIGRTGRGILSLGIWFRFLVPRPAERRNVIVRITGRTPTRAGAAPGTEMAITTAVTPSPPAASGASATTGRWANRAASAKTTASQRSAPITVALLCQMLRLGETEGAGR